MRRLPTLLTVILMLGACGSSPREAPTTTAPAPGDATTATTAATVGTTTTPETAGEGLVVVATTSILGDIVSRIVGDDGRVEVLMGPGIDPHDFSPSAPQAALLRTADLVVANGLALEEGMIDMIEAAEDEGANVLELADQLDPIPFGADAHDDHADEDHTDHADEDHTDEDHAGHDHGDEDPHFWMDPLRMADAADLIAASLSDLAPDGPWQERASALRQELEELHAEIESMFEAIPDDRRKLVTNHDNLGYLADRYGFDVVATVVPGGSTLAEPSAAELAGLVEILEEEGIRAIFAETVAPSALAEAVAAEIGEEVVVYDLFTDALGEPGSDGGTYIDMMRSNAATIADALG